MLRNVTVLSSPGLRKLIFAFLTMLPPFDCSIVSFTGTEKTCEVPVFLTVTSNAMLTVTGRSVWALVLSSVPAGRAFVVTSPVPHGELWPAVAARARRDWICAIAVVDASSGFCRNDEGGPRGPPLSF